MNDISDYMIRQCPICGKPYTVWSTIGGNQSVCPDCRRTALLMIIPDAMGQQTTLGSFFQ